jgi:NhaA family Na+:H+ antiporter
MKTHLTTLFTEFFESEQASGIILIVCTLVALVLANSPLGQGFVDFWQLKVGVDLGAIQLKYSVEHWINDGLMALFFLLIGLEIERELYVGELSAVKQASLPLFAAFGGMAMPALLHFGLNWGTATQRGIGIPMATDIAFALGVLSLLGKRVPIALPIFLTALAILDDVGAIVMIALFYVQDFSLLYLVLALGIFVGLLLCNRLRVQRLSVYLLPGLVMWYCMLKSGVHATLAGVLLAFTIPFTPGERPSPSYRVQHFLHKPVAFLIMPLFALANTGIVLPGNWAESVLTSNSVGILLGLVLGKPLGIVLCTLLAVKWRVSQLPSEVGWQHIIGAGFLGGIGFTMSIFITLLAFGHPDLIQGSKISILLSSLVAGATGFLILQRSAAGSSPRPL